MGHLRFKREPIVWVGIGVIGLETIKSVLSGEAIDMMAIQNFFVLVGILTGRELVIPRETHEQEVVAAIERQKKYNGDIYE